MNAKPLAVLLYSVLLGSVGLAPAGAASRSAINAFNEGVRHFNAHEFKTAIPFFDEAIATNPDLTDALYARGACKYYLKATQNALLDLNSVLRLEPDHVDARSLRGIIHYESDNWDEAITDFNAVLSQRSTDAQALLGRAIIQLKRNQTQDAAQDFRTFLRVRPDDPMVPEIRKVLASLNADASPASDGRPARRSRVPRQDLDSLSGKAFGNSLSDSFQNKVLRGENPQAVGDILTIPSAPNQKSPNSDYQIVDPADR